MVSEKAWVYGGQRINDLDPFIRRVIDRHADKLLAEATRKIEALITTAQEYQQAQQAERDAHAAWQTHVRQDCVVCQQHGVLCDTERQLDLAADQALALAMTYERRLALR